MRVLTLDYGGKAGAFDEIRTPHEIRRLDLAQPGVAAPDLPTFDAILVTSNASRLLGAGMSGARAASWNPLVDHYEQAKCSTFLIGADSAEDRRNYAATHWIGDASPFRLLRQRPEFISVATPTAFLGSLLRFLGRHADYAMGSPGLDVHLPVGGGTKPAALRTLIRHQLRCGVLLPEPGGPLDCRDALDLLQVMAHYVEGAGGENSPSWGDQLLFIKNGVDSGFISHDELAAFLVAPGACFTYLVHVPDYSIYHHHDRSWMPLALPKRQFFAILPLFMHPGVAPNWDSPVTPFHERNGDPVEYMSNKARYKSLQIAVRKCREVGIAVRSLSGVGGRRPVIDASSGDIGIVIPSWCHATNVNTSACAPQEKRG